MGIAAAAMKPQSQSKRNLRFQFDMWHGNGNLDKAIDLLDDVDREDFRQYTRQNVSFSRGNLFVCRSKKIVNDYFNSIFPLDKGFPSGYNKPFEGKSTISVGNCSLFV